MTRPRRTWAAFDQSSRSGKQRRAHEHRAPDVIRTLVTGNLMHAFVWDGNGYTYATTTPIDTCVPGKRLEISPERYEQLGGDQGPLGNSRVRVIAHPRR